jgi:opacity protein-like surface antigen
MKRFVFAALALALLSSPVSAAQWTEEELKNAPEKWTPQEMTSGTKKYEFTRHVLSGSATNLVFLVPLNLSCGTRGGYEIQITKEPEHGTAEVVSATEFYKAPPDNNTFAHCNGKKVNGIAVTYKSTNGYQGADDLEVLELGPLGFAVERIIHVNVHGRTGKAASSLKSKQ